MSETITTITNFDERFSMVFSDFLVLLHFSMELFLGLVFPTVQHGAGGFYFPYTSFSMELAAPFPRPLSPCISKALAHWSLYHKTWDGLFWMEFGLGEALD